MDQIVKLGWVVALRKNIDKMAIFPLPNINPSYVSLASLLVIMPVIFWPQNLALLLILTALSLLLDWSDGLIARRYNRASLRGYRIDGVCDRLSEGVLVLALGGPWLSLWLINLILFGISWRTNIHFVLSIRVFVIIIIILKLMGYDLIAAI